MPAGRPCRVITISSSAASRRYFDRSSLTSASATFLGLAWVGRPFRVEPSLRFGFCDDREDLDFGLCNVIEHPDVIDAQAVLRLPQASETLDSAPAVLRLVCEMQLESPLDSRANRTGKAFSAAAAAGARTTSTPLWLHSSQNRNSSSRLPVRRSPTSAFTSDGSRSHQPPSGATRVSSRRTRSRRSWRHPPVDGHRNPVNRDDSRKLVTRADLDVEDAAIQEQKRERAVRTSRRASSRRCRRPP